MSGIISSSKLEDVRAASDIVEVIQAYVPLKRAGANFSALCPFHQEKTPSFNVNPRKQIFHCFGCGKGGDVFTFVREYENIGFVEAVRRMAERAHIPLELTSDPADSRRQFLKETLLKIHAKAAGHWRAALDNDRVGGIARDYLAERGVSKEAIELFGLGYAPDSWDDTVNWAQDLGFDLNTVEQAGLIVRRERESGFYGRFRGRLMFPICDEQGRVIGFSGRVLAGDGKAAKYVNSPETPLFSKSRVIFGLDKSRRALLDAGRAIVCEGQLDLIACYMAGIRHVVAPQGTALTGQHCRILKRYVDEVVLCFDSDAAGQNAALRSLDDLIASGLAIRVAVLPSPHDPDSFLREHGEPAFRRLIEDSEDFFEYLLNRLCRENDLSSDRGRVTVLRRMADAVLRTENAVTIDAYAQKTAQRLAVSIDAVRAEFKKTGRHAPAHSVDEEYSTEESADSESPPSEKEFWLLRLLFAGEREDEIDFEWLQAHLNPDWLNHAGVRRIVERCSHAHTSGGWKGVGDFLARMQGAGSFGLVTRAASERHAIPRRSRQLADVVLWLRNRANEKERDALVRRVEDPTTSDEERLELMQRQQELRMQRNRPLSPYQV